MNAPITPELAASFACEWIEAWNARDLDRILKHYSRDVEFTSPFVCRILGRNDNTVRGIAELRGYFSRALNDYPDLHFVARRAHAVAQSLIIEYQSVEGRLVAETMEFDDNGLIMRARVHYAPAGLRPEAQVGL